MLFNSIQYILFLPTVVILYFALPQRYRWTLLLAASCYFYMCWKVEYIFLLAGSIMIDYYVAICMDRTEIKSRRRIYLLISLVSNVGILFTFKYFNFLNDSFRAIFNHFNIFYGVPAFNLLLPVGISFYIFQSLSYSIDVYRGQIKAERHLGIFALYVVYFPQLVAGPIERSTHLLPQFRLKQKFDFHRVYEGLTQILWGFFKKVVIADRLAVYVNEVYNNPGSYAGAPVLLATYFFAFQIYCDFSGYSDIAIGSARILGHDLMTNFKRPYFSKSIAEFWQRWHISLSTWFRDYLYIPLGGNRVGKWRWYYNLLIVFIISGIWHGANWTFFLWGFLHGIYLVSSILTNGIRQKISHLFGFEALPLLQKCMRIFVTFHLVLFSWIFFRANSLGDAFLIIKNIFAIAESSPVLLIDAGFGLIEFSIALFTIMLMLSIHLIERRTTLATLISQKPLWMRWTFNYALILLILNFGMFHNPAEFIYFQF
ncbi:MBOAT family protein [candidate division KSB1 bacterium]|nr:MAG: MBOAT family protein [candidate division KSB1 bacterium]MBC6946581.1 MBOAT family protein [candidate division KSB1 bacterium]MCE7940176.1 MBOAT family protein [Chlorobi bacterium CHB1]MDL1873845.1 MBOAT family protein [Cytophagia bacterium CHB2]